MTGSGSRGGMLNSVLTRRFAVNYRQWRMIVTTAATRLANARNSPVSSMSSPLSSVARQRQSATALIRARMRDFDLGLVMAFTMWHHYRATVE
jgi:hypothetical protein